MWYVSITIININIIAVMEWVMFGLFRLLEENVGPSILTVSAL
jgi:hypothetical protein